MKIFKANRAAGEEMQFWQWLVMEMPGDDRMKTYGAQLIIYFVNLSAGTIQIHILDEKLYWFYFSIEVFSENK